MNGDIMDDLKSYNLLFEEIKDFEEKDIKKLKKLGVKSYFDLLYNFPRAYEDRTNIKKISEVTNDEFVIIKATVIRAEMTTSMNRRKLFKAKVTDGTGYMELTWFGMPYAKNYVKEGNDMVFIGQVKRRFGFQMVNPEFKVFTARDLRRTCKTLMGEAGISKEIRDRIQNHALNDVSSKHYDRYDYLPEKRRALEIWEDRVNNYQRQQENNVVNLFGRR